MFGRIDIYLGDVPGCLQSRTDLTLITQADDVPGERRQDGLQAAVRDLRSRFGSRPYAFGVFGRVGGAGVSVGQHQMLLDAVAAERSQVAVEFEWLLSVSVDRENRQASPSLVQRGSRLTD